MSRLRLLAIGFVIALPGAVHSQSAARDHPILTSTTARGDGGWKTDGLTEKVTQRWDLSLRRGADGSISGQISVDDSPLLATGTVQGRLDGRRISGVILDEAGNRAASFEGNVGADRVLRGTYTDRTGETGEWEWEGDLEGGG